MTTAISIHELGQQSYQQVWQSMQNFTDTRTEKTNDEIWLVEHPAVFTQGQAGKAEHILNPGNIPVIQTDRGGQVTYHGPGQLVAYTLIDIRRRKMTIRKLVNSIEHAVINVLAELSIAAHTREDAPGVYVDYAKICSIGLRVRRGCSYHGLAFNINMDLSPFERINPCGFSNLKMTQISDLIGPTQLSDIDGLLVKCLQKELQCSARK